MDDANHQIFGGENLTHKPSQSQKAQSSVYKIRPNTGILYKRGFSLPYLCYLDKPEAEYVMREVQEGICSNHSGAHSLVHKLV